MEPRATGATLTTDSQQSASDRVGLPFLAVLGIAVGFGMLMLGSTELRDVDLYWHILAGEELSSGVPPGSVGRSWSFSPVDGDWTTTQWLSEWLLFQMVEFGGWAAPAAMRVATGGLGLLILARSTLGRFPVSRSAVPFALAAASVVLVSQERPQQATLVGAAALGGVLLDVLQTGKTPRWYVALPLTTIWANLHGGWVLVPAVLGLGAVGRALDSGLRDRSARRAGTLAAAAVLAGMVTPAGLEGLTAAWRFREAAALILEWQPTQPTYSIGVLTVAMLALLGLGWARSALVPRSELLAALALAVLAWSAWRNVAPSLALLAPLVSSRLVAAWPPTSEREPRWSRPVGLLMASAMTIGSLAGMQGQSHLPYSTRPVDLSMAIAELPAGQKVLNDYNVAGLILFFGGPTTRVAIDGRADLYGADYISDYFDLTDLQGNWRSLLASLDPTAALVLTDSALAYELAEIRGWELLGVEGNYSLLVDR